MLKVISALLLATVILSPIVVSALLLNNPIMLYDLFKDYLEGRNIAAITINIEPKINGETVSGTYVVVIHNLTASRYIGHSEIIHMKRVSLPARITFKVWRIPIKILPNKTVLYEPYEFLVIVANPAEGYLGSKIVEVWVQKPINIVSIGIELKPGKIHTYTNNGDSHYLLKVKTKEDTVEPLAEREMEWSKNETQETGTNIQLHSIPDLKVGYFVKENTVLYFESYTSDWYGSLVCPTPDEVEWNSNGKKETYPLEEPGSPVYLVENGAKGKLKFDVIYILEKWWIHFEKGGSYCYYVLYPSEYYGGSGEIYEYVSCSQCEGTPPDYAGCSYGSVGQELNLDFGPGGPGNAEIKTVIGFSFGYKVFYLSISWYREIEIDRFEIWFKWLKSGTLCRWRHNNDPNSYRAHFAWG